MVKIPANQPTIMIVDDSPDNITVLEEALSSDYAIRVAINGHGAIKAVSVDPLPDLILMDVTMPDMDGYSVCRLLKANLLTRHIPIIFITGKNLAADELHGFELGAVDYITKPVIPSIVRMRVKTHLALRKATRILEQQNLLLAHERKVIETIILRMRSGDFFDRSHLHCRMSPVEQTTGDMLLSAFTPDGRQMVLLGDFTGHGLTAAIGGPLVAYIFHALTRQGKSGSELLDEINAQLHAQLPIGLFFAAALVEVSAQRQQAIFLNAGIPGCLLIRNGDHVQIDEIPSLFPPLGILATDNFASRCIRVDLKPCDRICLFSDGIVEAQSRDGEMFGMGRMRDFLIHHIINEDSLDLLLNQVNSFCETTQHDDDITLVEMVV
ncbi:MAG: SpoIIE family protein phosphatase [Magnetococcales bacterium]|nr:SpoIIE family protein phosphatase [Magnetococcales bacterium]